MRHIIHTLRENVTLLKRDVLLAVAVCAALILLGVLGGYFLGRSEQMAIDRGVLEQIADVNVCFE